MPKLCEYVDKYGNKCRQNAIYGKTKLELCKGHKVDGMTMLKKQECGVNGCTIKKTYGKNKGKPLTCAKHATRGHTNVVKQT